MRDHNQASHFCYEKKLKCVKIIPVVKKNKIGDEYEVINIEQRKI